MWAGHCPQLRSVGRQTAVRKSSKTYSNFPIPHSSWITFSLRLKSKPSCAFQGLVVPLLLPDVVRADGCDSSAERRSASRRQELRLQDEHAQRSHLRHPLHESQGHSHATIMHWSAWRLHLQLLASFQDTQQETQAIHLAMQAGSYLEFSVPMLVEESGYTTKVYGQAMNVDCSTSLPFRDFIKCETLEVGFSCYCSGFIDYHYRILTSICFAVDSGRGVWARLERAFRLDS